MNVHNLKRKYYLKQFISNDTVMQNYKYEVLFIIIISILICPVSVNHKYEIIKIHISNIEFLEES